jgi:hypothetical protein
MAGIFPLSAGSAKSAVNFNRVGRSSLGERSVIVPFTHEKAAHLAMRGSEKVR